MPPDVRPALPPVAPAGHSGGLFLARKLGSSTGNRGNKKAEQKPRFLDVAICRRSIRGRLIINHCFLAQEYDGNTTVLKDPVSIFRAIVHLV
ncbi:MAG: hypothetical protein EOR72_24605 [Mesorhizobium sp.]|uniref:hypothetical protein n=1 Tax=Mesorhizobium sp. TaxID=1871066 RepID=UPI000FE5676E|nr:hypothetical protein [Mesorhizobium sp.]RWL51506.1 MAG: hypothetical protein EOR62_21180 [Mesorhizobium sp.]RWL57715.1 MAG: hypothetical protein EOR64_29445 [Mesorhizobium sp.]RWM10488.1 MAG: hypothetical protein EOR72_24605 [Mesorhizobium sp.]TIP50178.1 MAG: hypothetical protein E5X69_12330 [Mesorhizobium sp.]